MLTLAEDEIERICKGLKQNAAKCRFLRGLGFRVERRPDGYPIVFRAQVESVSSPEPRWTK